MNNGKEDKYVQRYREYKALTPEELFALIEKRNSSGAPVGPLETELASRLISPENIAIIVSLISAAIGLTTTAIKGIQLWIDERRSRSIKIKYENLEVEITRAVSEGDINKKLAIFQSMRKTLKAEDIKILVSDK